MLVCPDRKITFFKPLKSAGTSVEAALVKDLSTSGFCAGDEDPVSGTWTYESYGDNVHLFHAHTWPKFFFDTIGTHSDEYSLVTVARNPYDAAVSYYWYLALNNQENPDVRANTVLVGDADIDIQRKFETLMLTPDPGDSDLLMQYLDISHEKVCPLVYLTCVNMHFFDRRIDYFLKYENLDRDFDRLCAHLKIANCGLPKHKSYTNRIRDFHFSKYHTSETKRVVRNYFASINEAFGYTC